MWGEKNIGWQECSCGECSDCTIDKLRAEVKRYREALETFVDVALSMKEYRDACSAGESRKLSTFELMLYDAAITAADKYTALAQAAEKGKK